MDGLTITDRVTLVAVSELCQYFDFKTHFPPTHTNTCSHTQLIWHIVRNNFAVICCETAIYSAISKIIFF